MEALRAAGAKAWSIVGIAIVAAGVVFLLMLLRPLAIAVGASVCIAVVLSPVTQRLIRRGMRPGLAATLGLLALILVGIGVAVLVVTGLASQWDEISTELDAAVGKLRDLLDSAGLHGSMADAAQRSIGSHSATLLVGLLPALGNLLGTAVGIGLCVFLTLFTTFFLLKDGPAIVAAAGPWVPIRGGLGPRWLEAAGGIVRGYVVGLTLLGAFNAAVVSIGALILGVPLVGAIAVVTLLGNYIPYLGAWIAGAFAVLIALASGGVETAMLMTLFVLIANGILQTLLQPFAYGAALKMSPLVLLLVIIAGGMLAGIVGVVLAAPLAAIVQHTVRMLRETPN